MLNFILKRKLQLTPKIILKEISCIRAQIPYFLLLAPGLKLASHLGAKLAPPLINAAPRKAALIRKRAVNQLLNYFLPFINQGNFIIFTNSGSYVSSK